jgi:hypothetical protein
VNEGYGQACVKSSQHFSNIINFKQGIITCPRCLSTFTLDDSLKTHLFGRDNKKAGKENCEIYNCKACVMLLPEKLNKLLANASTLTR